MNGRRETLVSEVFNVGILSCGVTRVCLNSVGKVPVRRDVLMMCVSAGKSEGEVKVPGEGVRGLDGGWRGEVWILLSQ